MAKSSNETRDAIIRGLAAGWPKDHIIKLDASVDADLQSVFGSASVSVKASLARLAASWSNQSLQKEIAPIVAGFIRRIEDGSLAIKDRINAANELMRLDSGRVDSAEAIEGLIGPALTLQSVCRSDPNDQPIKGGRTRRAVCSHQQDRHTCTSSGSPSCHVVATSTDNATPVLDQSR